MGVGMKTNIAVLFFCVLTIVGCNSCSEDVRGTMADNIRGEHSQLTFDYDPATIEAICTQEQDRVKARLQEVAGISVNAVSFENSVQALERSLAYFSSALEPVSFLKYVSPDEKVRAAADQCEEAVRKLYVDIFAREDLYQVVKAYSLAVAPNSDPIDRKLVEEYMIEFKRNGLELSPEKRKLYIEKKKKLVELSTEFDKNLVEWKETMEVSKQDLEGLPEDFINSLEKSPAGNYVLTLAYPHYYPFMENAKSEEARKRLEVKFFGRGGDRNRVLLEEAIGLRHELARMLGYATHAEYVQTRQMAQNPKTVNAFLADMRSKLIPSGQENLKELLEIKKKDDPSATAIHSWDWRYYENQLKKEKYQVDLQEIKEYFPLDVVNAGMFELYQTLLGVTFVEDKGAKRWHSDVLAYQVIDNKTKKHVASFYMDLFPRTGKYNHAAAFTLLSGQVKPDGTYQLPVSSIVANYQAPSPTQPSLLSFNEVETQFHEFGHIMHQVLTKSKYATFSGTAVKRDFVEAPSQMLENWVWQKDALTKLSGHYKDHSKKLPDDLLNSLIRAKLVNSGIRYLRQVFFGMLDMQYHSSPKVDSTAIYEKLSGDVMLIPIPKGTIPQASFGHLMGGYDAGYYGYLWSEVYAQDMFTRFEKEGLLSPVAGAAYRELILEKGGTVEPIELITAFLGRAPNNKAFLDSLGLGESRAISRKTK